MDINVLIVDDSDLDCKMTRSFLEEEGIDQITEAKSAKEGLEKAHKHQYDLVISDVMMPDMNGFEFSTALRHNFDYQGKVILMTGQLDGCNHNEALQAGADRLLAKVPTGIPLKETIKEFFSK